MQSTKDGQTQYYSYVSTLLFPMRRSAEFIWLLKLLNRAIYTDYVHSLKIYIKDF